MTRPLDILLVDDEPHLRRTLSLHFAIRGYRVQDAATLEAARRRVAEMSFDVAFVDLRLGEDSGLDLVSELATADPPTAVVVITAHASIETAISAMKLGARDYLPKPFRPAELDLVIERLGVLDRLERRYRALARDVQEREPAPTFSSQAPAMQRLFDALARVAPSEVPVLIGGPSGAGKEVLAREIHRRSARREGPFVVVPCPSLPSELLESELFGHVRGAFTGATRDSQGRVALAEGGTLLLDEIGDLPLALQPKLLRFLQTHEYEAVGDPKPRHADVRVLAATNRDLEAAIESGAFREDLFYRLNVIRLELPGLAERPADVLPLARRFLGFFAQRHGRSGLALSPASECALLAHCWPGNVRELRNAIERATILAAGAAVEPGDLALAPPEPTADGVAVGRPVTLAAIETEHIRRVLAATGSYREAAEVLGIDETTLWRKRKQLGL